MTRRLRTERPGSGRTGRKGYLARVSPSGRAGRQEFWTLLLTVTLTLSVITAAGTAAVAAAAWQGLSGDLAGAGAAGAAAAVAAAAFLLTVLAAAAPLVGTAVRRLHDIGRSGLWLPAAALLMVGPAPVVTVAVLLAAAVALALPGEVRENKYGAPPAGAGGDNSRRDGIEDVVGGLVRTPPRRRFEAAAATANVTSGTGSE